MDSLERMIRKAYITHRGVKTETIQEVIEDLFVELQYDGEPYEYADVKYHVSVCMEWYWIKRLRGH
jgi:hypothetical protein